MDLERIDWPSISKRLTRFAYTRIRGSSWDDAEDLAQQAIEQMLDGEHAEWDQEKHPDPLDHLTGIVRGLVANRWRKLARQKTEPLHKEPAGDASEQNEDDADGHADCASPAVGPERALSGREIARQVVTALGSALAGDVEALALLECMKGGVDSPSEQRAATGLDASTLKNARKRLSRKVNEIRRGLEVESEEEP